MTLKTNLINIVLVGDNFPSQSIKVSDFTFRGRQFDEKLRVGPALQATSRNVTLTALPDRFECAVAEPDNLSIQVQGIAEVVAVFQEYVGRRSVRQVGHNAQFLVPPTTHEAMIRALVRFDVASQVLGADIEHRGAVVLHLRVEGASYGRLTLNETESGGVMDFNFHYNLDELDGGVVDTLSQLLGNLTRANEVAQAMSELPTRTRVAT